MGSSEYQFFEYAACSTCRKAKRWLDDHGVRYRAIPIVENPPAEKELAELVKKSGLPIEKWFNTSGQSYRALVADMGKEKFAALSAAEPSRATRHPTPITQGTAPRPDPCRPARKA